MWQRTIQRDLRLRRAARLLTSPNTFDLFFGEPNINPLHPALFQSRQRVRAARIRSHGFFERARESAQVIQDWVGQQLVVAPAFSQLLVTVAAQISNVYLRSRLLIVAVSEHSVLSNSGHGSQAGPGTLIDLADAIGIRHTTFSPDPETIAYFDEFRSLCADPADAVGAIGAAELLLVDEYSEIRACLAEQNVDSAKVLSFLDDRVSAQKSNAETVDQIATGLFHLGADPERYLSVAQRAIRARQQLYDQLRRRTKETSNDDTNAA
jgi:hypothetical protein